MTAVKPETDERFIRERALFCLRMRRALGLPMNYHAHKPVLLIQGGKSQLRHTDPTHQTAA